MVCELLPWQQWSLPRGNQGVRAGMYQVRGCPQPPRQSLDKPLLLRPSYHERATHPMKDGPRTSRRTIDKQPVRNPGQHHQAWEKREQPHSLTPGTPNHSPPTPYPSLHTRLLLSAVFLPANQNESIWKIHPILINNYTFEW